MFEALDGNVLDKFSSFDSSWNKEGDAVLKDFLFCLDQAQAECFSTPQGGDFSPIKLMQVSEGISAAKQIIINLSSKFRQV